MNQDDVVQIVTTTDQADVAERIAAALLDARLAACVQIAGPVTSHYVWQGKRERSQEWLCIIKALAADFSAIEAQIREVHNYQTPEILALNVTAGNGDYLEWLREQVRRE